MTVRTAAEKAQRLLIEHRLTVEQADKHGGLVVAECVGDTGTYKLGWDPTKKQWRCQCPEMQGRCSHLLALQSVVKRP